MQLLQRYVFQERDEILQQGIRLQVLGQIERLPDFVQKPLRLLCKDSARNADMTLNLALSYGSRQEIVDGVRNIARAVAEGRLRVDQIDEDLLGQSLYTAGQPDPDLLIRTSGELRLSNFLLWQLAYTEMVVTDVLWPDFRAPQLEAAIRAFGARERRFGKTGAQVRGEGSLA
jgi:undecaprenyl diphosphate synthase